MAVAALTVPITLNSNGVDQPRLYTYFSSSNQAASFLTRSNRSTLSSLPTSTKYAGTHANGFQPVLISGSARLSGSDLHAFDVVIVGAGIIGLTIARQFLVGSKLSVAVVDAAVPCAGATGAGQGYIWRVHKIPGSDKWELAMRSHELWENLAESVKNQGMDPVQALGWKRTGSMLVGRTADDCSVLEKKVKQLVDAGVNAVFLSPDDLLSEEPALKLGDVCGAAFVPDDCQLDAKVAVAFLEKANRSFAAEGRYAEFYHEPVTGLLRHESSGEVEAVQTSKNTLHSKKAVVVAAGCWSGSLMHELLKNSEIDLNLPIKPRKGHLLVLENFNPFNLNHGIMEAGYVNHESAVLGSATSNSETKFEANVASVSMTATEDALGRLVLGSSRQLVGFDTEIEESILQRIWDRAGEFFPVLKEVPLKDLRDNREVRVGLRPYMAGGKPVIGPVPGLSKMFIAAGHEGEGLSLAMGTAEMIFNMVLNNPQKVNSAPFSV